MHDAFETLSRLVAKSLVQAEPHDDGSLRYRLLEPLRQFGWQRLSERGDLERARRTHAEHIVALVEQASPALQGPEMIRGSHGSKPNGTTFALLISGRAKSATLR